MPSLLLLLWLVPLAVAIASRRRAPLHVWRNVGLALGAVVSPATLGLYGLYFLGPIAAIVGLIGLPLVLVHGAPGYQLAVLLGLIPPNTVIEGSMHMPIEVLNAVVWSPLYGVLGGCIDWWLVSKRSRNENAA